MAEFIAKRVRFQNGKHHSVPTRPGGFPTHGAALYLTRYRERGLAANSIHGVCRALAFLYWEPAQANIDLLERTRPRQFLMAPELSRSAEAVQYGADDSEHAEKEGQRSRKIIDIKRIRMRCRSATADVKAASEARRSVTDL